MAQYVAPWWLGKNFSSALGASFAGHIQTLVPPLCLPHPEVQYTRERWHTPDGDFIDADWVNPSIKNKPLVVLFHGLEGTSSSHYARALMAAVAAQGWCGVVPHFRSCSGEMNLAPRFYHSGDSAEIAWMLKTLADKGFQTIYAMGVSLGGNALLKFLGNPALHEKYVKRAVAVCAPLDLTASGMHLGQGFNRIYTKNFLNTLKKKSLKKWQQFPGLFDKEKMLASRNLYEFDNLITAPLHGYKNTDDYWLRASAKPDLPFIVTPTLLINAQNDPFVPKQILPRADQVSSHVTLLQPKQGGHVGFATDNKIWHWPSINWLPNTALEFFKASPENG
jgi:predicted alpha/beta-fold hydrolase